MNTSPVVKAKWISRLANRIKAMPFVEGVEFTRVTSEEPAIDFALKIKLSSGTNPVSALPRIAELITTESREEYLRTGKLPTLYWEIKPRNRKGIHSENLPTG